MSKILVVAAHPDDEILGCGATTAKMVENNFEVYTLILGEGITSRDKNRNKEKRKNEIEKLRNNIYTANNIIGVQDVYIESFPDNRFDTVPLLDIIKTIEELKDEIKPEIIFTHYENDLNIDHQITYRAVLTATRPMKNETVRKIYSFETLSATEWNYPLSFSPDIFYELDKKHIEKKVEAMKKYTSEIRAYPHPRSERGIIINSKQHGVKIGCKYAEAFKTVRVINKT